MFSILEDTGSAYVKKEVYNSFLDSKTPKSVFFGEETETSGKGTIYDMYCKNCGAELNDRHVVCIICRKGKGVGNQYCAFCGEKLAQPGAAKCDACGHLTGPEDPNKPVTPDKMRFSPFAAALISAIMPGMGQACNGQLVKGILIFIAYVLLNGFTSGGVSGLVIQGTYAVIAAVDSFCMSKKLKNETAVGKYEFF